MNPTFFNTLCYNSTLGQIGRPLPSNVLIQVLGSLCALCTSYSPDFSIQDHYCSLGNPCQVASKSLKSLYSARSVSSEWNQAFLSLRSIKEHHFFRRIEDVYYPHEWHINSRVRRSVLLGRYRVFKTIDTEHGDRGVFRAFDFGSVGGCKAATEVIIKAWVDPHDGECVTERRVYETLRSNLIHGVPSLLANAYDDKCQAHVLVLEKLGPSLEDLLQLKSERCLDEKTVMALAIQMLDKYASLHEMHIVHNGIKPGNICLAGPTTLPTSLYLIDFGLSYFSDSPLPSVDRMNTVGNRVFLSVLGHHGISQSQRDDLESLGYLFSFLYHGSLPWGYSSSCSIPKQVTANSLTAPEIWRIKTSTPGFALFRDMDPCFLRFWKDVRSLAFGEKPEYALLKSYFIDAWEAKEFDGLPGEFDWLSLFNDIERGESAQAGGERWVEINNVITD